MWGAVRFKGVMTTTLQNPVRTLGALFRDSIVFILQEGARDASLAKEIEKYENPVGEQPRKITSHGSPSLIVNLKLAVTLAPPPLIAAFPKPS